MRRLTNAHVDVRIQNVRALATSALRAAEQAIRELGEDLPVDLLRSKLRPATRLRTRSAADADIPKSTSRGKETFFDGKVFDPADPKAYLASLQIKKVA